MPFATNYADFDELKSRLLSDLSGTKYKFWQNVNIMIHSTMRLNEIEYRMRINGVIA